MVMLLLFFGTPLYDGKWGVTQTVSWTAGEIPGTKKKVNFTGLNLAAVLVVEAEVTY